MLKLLAVMIGLLGVLPLRAEHTRAELVLSATAAKPGDTVMAGIHLRMEPGWHTYWKNPGDSGMATKIKWDLPPGMTAGETLWPVPEKATVEGFTTYDYNGEVVLLVPLKLAPDLKPGTLTLKAGLTWLECKELCLPGKGSVEASLEIGSETKASAQAGLIESWQDKTPKSGEGLSARASWENTTTNDTRSIVVEWATAALPTEADFYPDASDDFEVGAKTEITSTDAGTVRLRTTIKRFTDNWPQSISGVIVQKVPGEEQAFNVTLPLTDKPVSAGQPTATPPPTATTVLPTRPLWQMLVYAFIGGLILNIMPCVLPVIALKILGFVGQAKESPGRVKMLGLIYTAGVLVSFLALAGLVIAVQAAGQRAGWGMQFSSPPFVVGLTVLVLLVALNLFGVFEVTLSGRVLDAAGGLSSKEGAGGAFFNGVLATILATPCTAPFLGAALGFAFAQSAGIIILMFVTIGLGLAAPYVVLSWEPTWLKFLPKPGAWMEKFKVAMGFPMLATAIWLFTLTPVYYGKRIWWLGLFLVLVALAAWVFGEFFQRGTKRRGAALMTSLVLLVAGYGFAVEHQLRWREPLPPDAAGLPANPEDGQAWQRWSPEAVAQARAAGRPVLVDFTADWCLTCNTIVKPALESSSVQARLKEINAVALLADYTRFPPSMTDELARYGRAGVPMVLVYPKDSARPAMVLPEALTPGIVLDALKKAVE